MHRWSRRALLGAAVPALGGCLTSSCRLNLTEFETDAVERFGYGVGGRSAGYGGNCDVGSFERCLTINYLRVDSTVVDSIAVRTTDGEVVLTHGVGDGEVRDLVIAEFGRTGGAERGIVLLDRDGDVVDATTVSASCRW